MDRFERAKVIKYAEEDFNFFAALCLPSVMEYEFPPEYLAMTDMVEEAVRDTSKVDHNFALGLPRGHAKTTWAKIFTAWCFCFTEKQYALISSSNENKAQSFIGDVARILKSPNLTKLFGSFQEGAEKDAAGLKIFTYRGKTRILHAVGANGDPRGYNIDFQRPDIHICDDIQSRDNAKSDVESSRLKEWYLSTFYLTKSPKGVVHLYIGNTFPYEGCILSQLRKDPNYISFVVGAILANGEALWPELNSIEKLKADFKRLIAAKQPEIFLSELMNDDRSTVAIGFDYESIAKWDKEDYTPPQAGFIMIDVAGDKKDSDDTAIGACLIFDEYTKPYFREVDAGKYNPLNTLKNAMKMAVKYNIKAIYVEAVAYQSSLLFWADFITTTYGISGFEFFPVAPRKVPKNVRIMDSLRSLQAGELILHDDVRTIVTHQISTFDVSRTNNTDDILDLMDYMKEIPQKEPQNITLLVDALSLGTPAPSSHDYSAWENSPI